VALCVIVALEHAEWVALGPGFGESTRTPALLAQAGLRYVCDWANDEQPYRMRVPAGDLYALPVSLPFDDINALWERRIDIDDYEWMIRESFDTLYRDGADNARLLVLSLHPFLIGQPFRIGSLDAALSHIVSHDAVWRASGAEIIAHFAGLDARGKHSQSASRD
jgi:allantoinase